MEELVDEREDSAEIVSHLKREMAKLQSALDEEQSRRLNLDRENRELKAFIAVHCANNSGNAMSRVYADPLLGFELSFFREKYLSLAAADTAGSSLGLISGLEQQVKELTQRLENPSQQNLQKLLVLREAEVTKMQRRLDEFQERVQALEKDKEELAATAFVRQVDKKKK